MRSPMRPSRGRGIALYSDATASPSSAAARFHIFSAKRLRPPAARPSPRSARSDEADFATSVMRWCAGDTCGLVLTTEAHLPSAFMAASLAFSNASPFRCSRDSDRPPAATWQARTAAGAASITRPSASSASLTISSLRARPQVLHFDMPATESAKTAPFAQDMGKGHRKARRLSCAAQRSQPQRNCHRLSSSICRAAVGWKRPSS
mmetsp:Transcript_12005/g.30788  ORF Transcript_12005/g.30788 Transcript_12005/m.30788 type:complete len:206 (+) Transcript_12005:188-805(+)